MRDAAATLLHKKALRLGLDVDCIFFWCGQNGQIRDHNKYQKFMTDPEYLEEQYRIAEPWLNIISNPNPDAVVDAEKRLRERYEERIRKLEDVVNQFLGEGYKLASDDVQP